MPTKDSTSEPDADPGVAVNSSAASGSAILGSATLVLPALALVVALAAVAVSAWSFLQVQELDELPSRLMGDEGQLTELKRRIEILVEDTDKQRAETNVLREQLEAATQELSNVPVRLEQVEEAVASIPEISSQSRSVWLQREALYYLRVANAQALLSGNAELTLNALQLADEKLREAGDPAMAKVRGRIAEEIAALQALPQVDRTGISFRLQTLLTRADEWPLQNIAPDNYLPETAVSAEDLGPWDRFIATLKAVLASIITVKETYDTPLLQLSATEKALIVEGVKAELQVARLAFASNNTKLFGQSLERSQKEIRLYFDPGSAAVAAALETLGEIAAIELPSGLPDITGSLSLMLNTLEDAKAAAAGNAQ
jgi:uroporphyrin-3 C-methyltransferase